MALSITTNWDRELSISKSTFHAYRSGKRLYAFQILANQETLISNNQL
jgi:hypothetical protein